jgi:hypothetical protein
MSPDAHSQSNAIHILDRQLNQLSVPRRLAVLNARTTAQETPVVWLVPCPGKACATQNRRPIILRVRLYWPGGIRNRASLLGVIFRVLSSSLLHSSLLHDFGYSPFDYGECLSILFVVGPKNHEYQSKKKVIGGAEYRNRRA